MQKLQNATWYDTYILSPPPELFEEKVQSKVQHSGILTYYLELYKYLNDTMSVHKNSLTVLLKQRSLELTVKFNFQVGEADIEGFQLVISI